MIREDDLRFIFKEPKALAAAAQIVKFHGGAMELVRLVKLMYLAERESLRQYRQPIFGDRYFSMEHGPVVSHTYDLLKIKPGDPWGKFFQRVHNIVRLLAEPDPDVLSPNDVDVIARVCEEHQDRDTWQLVEHTHKLPEWGDHGKTSVPIPCLTLLHLLDLSKTDIERLREEHEAAQELEALLEPGS